MIYNKTDWTEQYKIRLANCDSSMNKHDIVKTLVVRMILNKNKRNRTFLHIYTEFDLNEGKLIPDIYVEDCKNKTIICYEIQKNYNQEYIKTKTEEYNKLDIPYFNSIDLIIIPLKNLSDNINEMVKQLDIYVV
jgi:hypothetical protein